MSTHASFDPTSLVTVTVTFNPEIELLQAQLVALPRESLKLVVDNASQSDTIEEIEALVSRTPNAMLLRNTENIGLAAAVNRGVAAVRASAPCSHFVLLLDQDSEPSSGSIERLVEGFEALRARGVRIGCVGPTLLDATTGLKHGFHQCTRWRWKRVYPDSDSNDPVACANLNGSGTLVPVDIFLELGGLEDNLFIDHVDTEWAFRVQAHGYQLFGIPQAVFRHRMGESSRRIWLFGWRVWPIRSSRRHYFLYRNAVLLMRRAYVPWVWKVWAVIKLTITAGVTLMIGPRRFAQMRSMVCGIRDAIVETKDCNV